VHSCMQREGYSGGIHGNVLAANWEEGEAEALVKHCMLDGRYALHCETR
jgi:hypothetical protein